MSKLISNYGQDFALISLGPPLPHFRATSNILHISCTIKLCIRLVFVHKLYIIYLHFAKLVENFLICFLEISSKFPDKLRINISRAPSRYDQKQVEEEHKAKKKEKRKQDKKL